MNAQGPRTRKLRAFDLQRRVVSHMVSESWTTIPHVSYLYEPDITEFYDEFRALAAERASAGARMTFNTILLRVIVEGLKSAPDLNAFIDYHHEKGEGTLEVRDDINISVPWVLPDGRMITPAILHAESMTLAELSEQMARLGERIANTDVDELLYRAVRADTVKEVRRFHLGVFRRIIAAEVGFHRVTGLSGEAKEHYYAVPEDDRLTAQNLISGTVTVSNIGSLYKEQRGGFGVLEIIPPQVFAVGIGAVQEKPGVYLDEQGEKTIGIRKVLPMCLVFDHRAVDFTALVPFLKRLDEIFLTPVAIRGW